jgi:hypothetical protein
MLVFCDDTDLTGTPRLVHQLQWCGAAIVQIEVIEVDNWNPTFSGRNCDLTHPARMLRPWLWSAKSALVSPLSICCKKQAEPSGTSEPETAKHHS